VARTRRAVRLPSMPRALLVAVILAALALLGLLLVDRAREDAPFDEMAPTPLDRPATL